MRIAGSPAPVAVTVNTGTDANDGVGGFNQGAIVSLRWAIQQVDLGTVNQINFAIGALGTVATINLNPNQGVLPGITDPVFINGYSQNQGTVTGTPWVQLNGAAYVAGGGARVVD